MRSCVVKAQLRVVVCDDSAKAMQLMSFKSSLEHIVVIEPISEQVRSRARDLVIEVISFDELKEIGRKNLKDRIVIERSLHAKATNRCECVPCARP